MVLRRFHAFLSIAEELNVTRAAARLGMAQPHLSQQIKALEDEVGVRLFRRLPRGLELTAAGEAFRAHAQQAVDSAGEAIAAARRVSSGQGGTITVGFTNSASFNPRVTSCIARFRQRYPRLSIKLVERPTAQLVEELDARRIDVAFVRASRVDSAKSDVIPLPDERLHLVLPGSHRLARRRTADLSDFAREPFVLFPRANGPLLYDAVIIACNRRGFSPTVVQEAPQLSSAMTLVAAGIGLTVVPETMCQLHANNVSHAALNDPQATVPLSLAYLKDHESPSVERFINHFQTEWAAAS